MNGSVFGLMRSDMRACRRNPKGMLLCVIYRVAHSVVGWPGLLRPVGWLVVGLYKFVTEYVLGTEIHWRASIGPGLRIYHGYGLVVHSNAVLGAGCTLRQGVTIGSKDEEGQLTPVIGNKVNIGASALIIGSYRVGDGAQIGAGAVVVCDVPAGAVVVGNPGRVLRHG